VLAYCGLILGFCMDEEVCLLLLHGKKLLLASARWRNSSLWMSTFAVNGSCCSLESCFIADDENCCRDLLVGTAEVQKPWFLLPCNKRTVFEIFDFKMSWPWNPGQRSLKVTGTDMDRSATYDFLLTLHSNHEPISHRFRDKFTAISVDKKISYRGQTARRV